MNNQGVTVATAGLLLAGTLGTRAAQQGAPTPPQELKVTIDSKQTARPVSPYEYGMFIEHIGQLIYRSLWSEMLDDRMFYFPIKPGESQPAAPAQGGAFRNMQLRKWHPLGPAGSPTSPLDMVAALSADHRFLTLAVVNATDAKQKFDLDVTGVGLSSNGTLWQMAGKSLSAANKVGESPQVEMKHTEIGGVPATLSVPSTSVEIYRFPVMQTAP